MDIYQRIALLSADLRHALARGDEQRAAALEIMLEEAVFTAEVLAEADWIIEEAQE